MYTYVCIKTTDLIETFSNLGANLLFMLGYLLLIMISSLLNPVQGIEIKTDFNSFYEEEQKPYHDLLKLIDENNLPSQQDFPNWLSKNKIRATSAPNNPSSWLKEKLGIVKLEELGRRRAPIATEFFQEESKHYLERKFLITDSIVGKFEVSILSPGRLSNKSPILLALHGHGGSADDFKDVDFIRELASKGTIVVIPNFRAMQNLEEVQISRKLFRYGFSLMGVRIYECLRILNLVKKLFSGKRKIGLIGHSGGSAIASLLAWMVPNVEACAIDYESTFRRSWKTFCCEAIPELHNNGSWLFSSRAFPVPLRKFPYNFVPENQAVSDFFVETLTPPENITVLSKKDSLPSSLQMGFDQLIKKPSIFSSELTSQLVDYLDAIESPLRQDSLVLKSFKHAFLMPVEQQPTFLFKKLNTPAFKLNFFSHLSVLSDLESTSLKALESRISKLISNYPEGSQRNVIIAHTIHDLARSNPKIALRLLSKINSMVTKMSVTGRRLLAEASLITLHSDPDPSSTLKFWPVNVEEKILLGAEWTCRIMEPDLKTRLSNQITKLFERIDKDSETLVPYPVLKNLVNPDARDFEKPIVSSAHSGEDFLSAMLRVGKILILRNRPEDSASLSQWFWDPEKGNFYLSELADNVNDEENIKILIMSLKKSLSRIKEPIFRVPFVRTLLRYFGDRGMHGDFESWFTKGLQFCLDKNWNFDRLEPKYTMMLTTAAEYGYSDLALNGLKKLPNPYYLDHILGALLEKSLEVGNNKMAELITSRYESFKSRKEFLIKIALSRSKYESIGMQLGQRFSDYALNKSSSEEFDLDSLRRALDEYRGSEIQDHFGRHLKKVLDHYDKKMITRHHIKVVINSLKAARFIQSSTLANQAETKLEQIFSQEVPEDWQNFILDWIEVFIQNEDRIKATKWAQKLGEEEIRVKYLVRSLSHHAISENQFKSLLKAIKPLDNHENRANIFLDFAESQIHNHEFFKVIIRELDELDKHLPSELRLEILSKLGSMTIENGYVRKGYEIIGAIKKKRSTLEEDLQFEALITMFSLARDLNNSALCFQILKELLMPLQSEKTSPAKLRIISELMIDFNEDHFPLEDYLISSIKRLLIEKLRSESSSCNEVFTKDEAVKSFDPSQVIEKCKRFLQD